MGFVLLGMMTLTTIGVNGAVLQMFSHGIIAALLFGVAGRMIYDRTRTRELTELGGLDLSRAVPFAAGTFVVASAASMGLPGFSGFIAELAVLLGTWQSEPWLLGIAAPGIVVTAAFTLKAMQYSFFCDAAAGPVKSAVREAIDATTFPERAGAVLLIAVVTGVGLYPGPLMDLIASGFDSPLMRGIFR